MATTRKTSLDKKVVEMNTPDEYSFRVSPTHTESSPYLQTVTKQWIYLYEGGKIKPSNYTASRFYKKPKGSKTSNFFGKIEYKYNEDNNSYYYAWDNGKGLFGYIGADYNWYRHGTKHKAYVPKTRESKELVGAKKQAKRDERQAKVDKVTAKVSASVDKKVVKAKSSAKTGGKFIARGFLKMYGLNVPTALQKSSKGGFKNGEIQLTDRQIIALMREGYDVEQNGLDDVPMGVLQRVLNGTSASTPRQNTSGPKSAPQSRQRAPAPPVEDDMGDIDDIGDDEPEQTVEVKTSTLTKKQKDNFVKHGFAEKLGEAIIELPIGLLYLLQ